MINSINFYKPLKVLYPNLQSLLIVILLFHVIVHCYKFQTYYYM